MKNIIKRERAMLDVTQEELSGMVQVTRQTILALEKDREVPSVILALKLASIFSRPVSEIFELEEADWECH